MYVHTQTYNCRFHCIKNYHSDLRVKIHNNSDFSDGCHLVDWRDDLTLKYPTFQMVIKDVKLQSYHKTIPITHCVVCTIYTYLGYCSKI